MTTEYLASDGAADRVLAELRRFDHLAIRAGYSWSKVPAGERVDRATERARTKDWSSALMGGDGPVDPESGRNSMTAAEREKLREFLETI